MPLLMHLVTAVAAAGHLAVVKLLLDEGAGIEQRNVVSTSHM